MGGRLRCLESSPIRRQFQIVSLGGGEVPDSPRVGVGAEYIAVPPYHTPTLTPIPTAIQLKSHPECTIISPDRLPYIIEGKDAPEDIKNYRSTYSALLG